MIDLHPAARRMAELVAGIDDADLAAPTPCPGHEVGALVDHVAAFATGFIAVARKDLANTGPPPPASGDRLADGWRDRIVRDLDELADAWDDPAAWTGDTAAGGIPLTGDDAGLVALDELVVHGWDLAVATGRAYEVPDAEAEAATAWITSFEVPRDGSLFGPEVSVDPAGPPLDRLLGLAGRDPAWRPPA